MNSRARSTTRSQKGGLHRAKERSGRGNDSVLIELQEVKQDLERYLQRQRQHFGVKVMFPGRIKSVIRSRSRSRRRRKSALGTSFNRRGKDSGVITPRRGSFDFLLVTLRRRGKVVLTYITHDNSHQALLSSADKRPKSTRNKVLKDLSRRIFAQFSEKYDA